MTVAYGAVLSLLVQGHKLDKNLSGKLMDLVKTGQLPFHAVTYADLQPPRPGDPDPPRAGRFASPDALLTPSSVSTAAADPGIPIERVEGISHIRHAVCYLSPASRSLLSGCPLPSGLRVGCTACGEWGRAKPGARPF
ncbi:hypothetical protein [Nitrosospira multiformis]|uniref:hypothetical protein n=1 Tax=Nitrosospira multiformis TaxID=1231 RepID=UPI00215922E2|nr:hypothetical protein [Nitrosospira multiformis]